MGSRRWRDSIDERRAHASLHFQGKGKLPDVMGSRALDILHEVGAAVPESL